MSEDFKIKKTALSEVRDADGNKVFLPNPLAEEKFRKAMKAAGHQDTDPVRLKIRMLEKEIGELKALVADLVEKTKPEVLAALVREQDFSAAMALKTLKEAKE